MVRKRKRSYKRWTTADDNSLVALRAAGKTWNQVGEKLGVSGKAAAQRGTYLVKNGATLPVSKAGRPRKVVTKPSLTVTKKASNHVKSEAKPTATGLALTPLAEVDKSLGKLRAYIALLEARNASLQSKLNEIEKTLRD